LTFKVEPYIKMGICSHLLSDLYDFFFKSTAVTVDNLVQINVPHTYNPDIIRVISRQENCTLLFVCVLCL